MPRNYLSFLMLVFAAVFALVLYDFCYKPKKRISASKIYSGEREQREMFGHTGAEAYEMMMSKKSKSDTVTLPIESYKSILGASWFMRVDTLGNITIAIDSSASYLDERNLKIRLVAGRWEVESALPVRVKLKDGFIENNGDSIAVGFEYGDIAKDFDDLIEKVKAKKRRGESWFVGTPLTPDAADYLIKKKAAPTFKTDTTTHSPALEAKGRVRSVLDPKDYNTVQEWRMPEEIVADQKWLDSFFARLDSVLSDTTKKQ